MPNIILTQQEYEARNWGSQGFDLINDTNDHRGDWIMLKVLEDTEIVSMKPADDFDSLAGIKLSAPDVILVDFEQIKLSKGVALAYKRGLRL
jgi:hypothetical protein